MNREPTYLGLDVGTSSVKGVLADVFGAIVATAEQPLALSMPEPLAAEQDPEDWWRAVVHVTRSLVATPGKRIVAVGLTGQKHAFLPLDAENRPLSPAVLWCDGRALDDAKEVERRVPRSLLGKRTGSLPLPGYLVPKWLRFRRLFPDRARKTARLAFTKDYVRLRLSGAFATDRSEASASLLYDVGRKAWSEDLLKLFDVPEGAVPQARASAEIAGKVSVEAAAETGLDPGTPIAAGAGDNETAALACGAVGGGVVAVVLGTSGTVVAHTMERGAAGGLAWGRHALRSGYAATGVVLSAGRAIEWVRSTIFPPGFTTEEMLFAAEASNPSEGPLVFVPSLAGERSPIPDPEASGAFVGLRPGHGRGHLARAVVDGVSLAIADVVALMRGAGVKVTELRATAGGARSPYWLATLAAATALPVHRMGEGAGSAFGAALIAARATTRIGTLAEVAGTWCRPDAVFSPDPAETERLRGLAVMFRAARTSLRGIGSSASKRVAEPKPKGHKST